MLDLDKEVETVLVNLGYPRGQVKEVLNNLPAEIKKLEDRLKEALRLLGRH
ncbi:MAG: RuvA C-terminal domain-containing protein [Patescibacteria group bacterium]